MISLKDSVNIEKVQYEIILFICHQYFFVKIHLKLIPRMFTLIGELRYHTLLPYTVQNKSMPNSHYIHTSKLYFIRAKKFYNVTMLITSDRLDLFS